MGANMGGNFSKYKWENDNRSPSPGQYDCHKPMGNDCNGIDMGSKYKFQAKDGPGPGEYDH